MEGTAQVVSILANHSLLAGRLERQQRLRHFSVVFELIAQVLTRLLQSKGLSQERLR